MSKIRMIKQYGTVLPYDDIAQGIIKDMPTGKVIEFSYSFPRNPGNHKRFFAFLNLAFDCQEHFTTLEAFRKWLIIKSGHAQIIQGPDGTIYFNPDSIAWDKMDEIKFKTVINDCVQAFIDTFGDKLPEDRLNEIVRF